MVHLLTCVTLDFHIKQQPDIMLCVYMHVCAHCVCTCKHLCTLYVYVFVRVFVQRVNDQLVLHASAGVSSLCSLLALVGQSQSDLLAIVPAKLVICFYDKLSLVSDAWLLQL